jgi:hypothetical protein
VAAAATVVAVVDRDMAAAATVTQADLAANPRGGKYSTQGDSSLLLGFS